MSNINADFRVAPVLGRQRAKHNSSCIRPSRRCLRQERARLLVRRFSQYGVVRHTWLQNLAKWRRT